MSGSRTDASWRARIGAAWHVLRTDPRLVLATKKRQLEGIARDAGCTKAQATRIAARYFAPETPADGQ